MAGNPVRYLVSFHVEKALSAQGKTKAYSVPEGHSFHFAFVPSRGVMHVVAASGGADEERLERIAGRAISRRAPSLDESEKVHHVRAFGELGGSPRKLEAGLTHYADERPAYRVTIRDDIPPEYSRAVFSALSRLITRKLAAHIPPIVQVEDENGRYKGRLSELAKRGI